MPSAPPAGWRPPAPAAPPLGAPPPVAPRRAAGRAPFAVVLCLVLGAGLLGGSVIGVAVRALTRAGDAANPARQYAEARVLWRAEPVDAVFPPTVSSPHGGPGGSARTWIRVGVAPDGGCAGAFDAPLAAALAPAGCLRLLRATYTDATSSTVTTVGVLVTTGSPAATAALRHRLAALAGDARAMPLPAAFPGTDAAGFGAAQRGCWTISASATLPLVVYAVSGFADGRAVDAPQPAAAATAAGADTVAGQAGLGFDAVGLSGAVGGAYTNAVHRVLDGAVPAGGAL